MHVHMHMHNMSMHMSHMHVTYHISHVCEPRPASPRLASHRVGARDQLAQLLPSQSSKGRAKGNLPSLYCNLFQYDAADEP